MAFIIRFLIATLLVTLTVFIHESQGRTDNRWRLQPPGLVDNLVDDIDYYGLREDLSSSLTRRATNLDKDKLNFPPFPGDDYDTIGLETEAPLSTSTDATTIQTTQGTKKPWYKKFGHYYKKLRGAVGL